MEASAGEGEPLGIALVRIAGDMRRDVLIEALADTSTVWDVVIIGGGATGLGAAVDAASRGYKTLLLEQSDFAKGTSSRSTKLVHGGVRYLQQGNLSLVFEALHERGLLMKNARHLVSKLPFAVPCYRWWERPYYGFGLKAYQVMARRHSLGRSELLSKSATAELLPTINRVGLRGGVLYYDGLFDDSRLAVNLAQTAVAEGGAVLNYVRVDELLKRDGRVVGVVATDLETGRQVEVASRVVINATGVFADSIRRMDQPDATAIIRPSQGIHLVLDRSFLPGEVGLMVPRTKDGRVIFALPWHGRVVLGTTDTPVDRIDLEPIAREAEIAYLLEHARRYLEKAPSRKDILSIFVGLRPLVSPDGGSADTASIARDHVLLVSKSGLITITGGKWTTYRRMAEDAVDKAVEEGRLEGRACRTAHLSIRGAAEDEAAEGSFSIYGSDVPRLRAMIRGLDGGEEALHQNLPYVRGEVHWAVEMEMARTVEDVLARRTRALILDARASIEAAPVVADILAERLGREADWRDDQVRAFTELAAGYLPGESAVRVRREKMKDDL